MYFTWGMREKYFPFNWHYLFTTLFSNMFSHTVIRYVDSTRTSVYSLIYAFHISKYDYQMFLLLYRTKVIKRNIESHLFRTVPIQKVKASIQDNLKMTGIEFILLKIIFFHFL